MNLIGTLSLDDLDITGVLSSPEEVTGKVNSAINAAGKIYNAFYRGIPVQLRINGTVLQWKYEDDDDNAWTNLIDLQNLDYEQFMNLPQINGVELVGNKTFADLGISDLFSTKSQTITNITRSGTTFTATRADGTTFTFTQQDNDTTYRPATTSADGLMSATDKAKLDGVERGAQVNKLESISVNGVAQAVVNKGVSITVPTSVSDLNNDLGYLVEESDPTVPQWAKQAQKPTYTASEVGALPEDTIIPTKVSDLVDDSGHYTKPSGGIPKDDLSSAVKASLDKADTAVQDVSDIQNLVSQLNTKLNALADSDDTTLDQLSEIVAYIKNNKDLIDGITTGKVSVADIVDNLTSTVADKPLSANQGRILKEMLEEVTGVEYHVCTDQEYDATTLVPTLAGDAGVIYLVPIPPDTGKTTVGDAVVGQASAGVTTYYDLYNGYTEWIYNDDKFERIGEQTATNNDIKKMLKSLGLIDDTAVIDEAVIDESVVG